MALRSAVSGKIAAGKPLESTSFRIPITPVFVALSAATPIFRSYLADDDSRWMALTAATDDRTRGESGEAPLVDGELRIARPRYFYADAYLSPSSASLNDLERVFHDEHFKLLLDGGVDETYARHIAHLFVRDPLQERENEATLFALHDFRCSKSESSRTMPTRPNISIVSVCSVERSSPAFFLCLQQF